PSPEAQSHIAVPGKALACCPWGQWTIAQAALFKLAASRSATLSDSEGPRPQPHCRDSSAQCTGIWQGRPAQLLVAGSLPHPGSARTSAGCPFPSGTGLVTSLHREVKDFQSAGRVSCTSARSEIRPLVIKRLQASLWKEVLGSIGSRVFAAA